MFRAHVVDALRRAIGQADPQRCKAGSQPALGAPAPAQCLPVGVREHCFDRPAELVGEAVLARASVSGDGEDHLEIDGIDLLLGWDAHCSPEISLSQGLAEGRAPAIARVRQDAAEAHTGGPHAVDLLDRDLGLAPEGAAL